MSARTPRLWLLAKADLVAEAAPAAEGELAVSAATGAGLDALREELTRRAGGDAEGAFSARARHVEALERAGRHLDAGLAVLAATSAGESRAEELRQAQHALGEITGATTADDLLGAIFSTFCVGK